MMRREVAHHQSHSVRSPRWYVYGTSGGKTYVYGGFADEDEALREGYTVKDWDKEPECIQLNTTDLTAAKSMIRAKMVQQSGSLFLATKRIYKGG